MTSAMQKQLVVLTVLAAVLFCGVSVVFADSVHIENTVESYSHTGGKSVSGSDGADGADGADGTSGKDGQSVESHNTSSVSIETYVNGEKVIDVHETNTDTTDTASETSASYGDEDSNVTVTNTVYSDARTREATYSLLKDILATIRLMTAFLW